MTRRCEYCGKPLERKRYGFSERLEDGAAFRKRKFCSRKCSALGLGHGRVDPVVAREMRKTMTYSAIAAHFGVTTAAVQHCLGRWSRRTGVDVPSGPPRAEPAPKGAPIGDAEVARLLREAGSLRFEGCDA